MRNILLDLAQLRLFFPSLSPDLLGLWLRSKPEDYQYERPIRNIGNTTNFCFERIFESSQRQSMSRLGLAMLSLVMKENRQARKCYDAERQRRT